MVSRFAILCAATLLRLSAAVVRPTFPVRKVSPFDAFLNLDPMSAEEEERFVENARYSMARISRLGEGGSGDARTQSQYDVMKAFKGKWIYVRGDSTMRMIVAALFG